MDITETDDRKIYDCFRVVKLPAPTYHGGEVCQACGHRITCGLVFFHKHTPGVFFLCDLLAEDTWGILCHYRANLIVICGDCFLPEVELCYLPGESEQRQLEQISLDADDGRGFGPQLKFKKRLRVNKSKSARKLADCL